VATAAATSWMGLSSIVAYPWYIDLSNQIGGFLAAFIIGGIAILPGFMNAFLVISLMLDNRPERKPTTEYPGISILIAAYHEAEHIAMTIQSLELQHYPGHWEVIVVNDGSHDSTAAEVRQMIPTRPWLKLIDLQANGGKANALNIALTHAQYGLVITLDADTYLYKNALINLVGRYLSDPPNTKAVAGTILVRNSRQNWITKAQEWEYFHGIASIKRMQSFYHGTLVAQGAFSLYERSALRNAHGWPRTLGEDIVLTWALLEEGYRVGHCEDACAFTNVPTTLGSFVKQRQRWARGMIEAFKHHSRVLVKKRLTTFFIWWDVFFPWMDLAFTLGFIPGIVLAFFGNYTIVGPLTLALLPLAIAINGIMSSVSREM
jgi:biofilm PGA synthesis N-glycosyltransferase PgaC